MARHFGYLDVDKMLSEISCNQAVEWEAFSKMDPLPEDRIKNQLALIAAVFSQFRGIKKISGGKFKFLDFIPQYNYGKTPPSYKRSMKQIKDVFMGLVKKTAPPKE